MGEMKGARVGMIVNPVAGRSRDPGHWNPVIEELRHRFPAAELRTTQGPGDERRAAAELLRLPVDRIVVAGGDGSIHQVVEALLTLIATPGSRPPLGLVPLGSGNDFARGLGIPLAPQDAIHALENARELTIDVGRITFLGETPARTAFWMNQSYVGFGARVVRRVSRGTRPADRKAYVRAALREVFHSPVHHYSLESDGRPTESSAAVNLLVTNGRFSGSGMLTSPRADPSDGAFDVVFVGPMGRIRLLRGLRRFQAGTHLSLPEVRTWRVKTLEVRGESPGEPVEADGDIVGQLPAAYEVLPGAIRVLVPETPKA